MTTTTRKAAEAKPKAQGDPPPPTTAASTHPNLASALVAFQAEMPVVPKGHTARIPGRDGGPGYSYTYADLTDVTAAAVPILTRHGLAFSCLPRMTPNGSYELAARLLHTSGEHLEAALPIAGRQAQEIGSSLTYGRRYLFGCMTGLVTDDDDDGAHANAAASRTQVDPPPPPPLSDAQAAVERCLARITDAEAGQVRSWWRAQSLPMLAALSDHQAGEVLLFLEELIGQRQPEADPTPPA